MTEIAGGLQLAVDRREAGYEVGKNQTDDQELVLLCAQGGMRGYIQASWLSALAENGLGPERFNKIGGASVGALAGATFIAGQHIAGTEITSHLIDEGFYDIKALWSPARRAERPVLDLNILRALITHDPYFGLDADAVCASNTELFFPIAKTNFSTDILSTKHEPRVGPDELIPALIAGAHVPVLGPSEVKDGKIDGATWNPNIVSQWNQAAAELNLGPEEAKKTHVIVLETSPTNVRLGNVAMSLLVAPWIAQRSEAEVAARDVRKQFMKGRLESVHDALVARITGSLVANAASVQVIRPGWSAANTSSAIRQQELKERGAMAYDEMLRIVDSPDSVRTYTTIPKRSPIHRLLAHRALAWLKGSTLEVKPN